MCKKGETREITLEWEGETVKVELPVELLDKPPLTPEEQRKLVASPPKQPRKGCH